MHFLEILIKKRNGRKLSPGEINYTVSNYTAGNIPDYQMAAWLMAVYFRGLDEQETAALTAAMAGSGQILKVAPGRGAFIDKHSTGGVGDGTSLVLAPLVAAAGVPVLMVSGRGLGHTGGTLDKLESVPGLRTDLTAARALRQVRCIGVAMIGQTAQLAPADKKIYALRDATGTVENISLICASILSKKIAVGIKGLVLDVKCGNGAFMKDFPGACKLAGLLMKIGRARGLKSKVLVTDMNQPLGNAIGNSLEIAQALEVLQGRGPDDFRELTLALGAEMLILGKKAKDKQTAITVLSRLLSTGQALNKFREMIKAQGGKIDKLPSAKYKTSILAKKGGYIRSFDTCAIGLTATLLGAGRQTKEDRVDPAAGIWLNKKLGDRVVPGEVLGEFHYNRTLPLKAIEQRFVQAITIGSDRPTVKPLIMERW